VAGTVLRRATAAAVLLMERSQPVFGIADGSVGGDVGTPVPSSVGGWLGAGESEVLIRTGQDIVDVALRMEAWTAEPPGDGAELSDDVRLRLPSGLVSVNEITGGWQPDVFRLPEAGTYQVRVDA
jgi:hypothetical protein